MVGVFLWGFCNPAWTAPAAPGADVPFPVIERFDNWKQSQGMPSRKIHSVLKASDGRVWIGTWEGLLVKEGDRFQRYTTADGLTHKMVLCLAEDPKSGDLWAGTMRGLNRISAGRITGYLQTDSGLPNNVVYGVDIVGDHVWTATAAGAGDLNLKTGRWQIYDHQNTPMHEPWCYAARGTSDRVFIGVWGGGILEHDPVLASFKEYRDPDHDFHFDLVPDDGPINDITSWIAVEEGIVWQTTYFGASRYDGRKWRTWVEGKSPLPSNFTQFVWTRGKVAWIGSDRGLSVTDGDTWVNYLVGEKGDGILEVHRPGLPVETRAMTSALPNPFVLGIWADDHEAWIATSDGLSRGLLGSLRGLEVAEQAGANGADSITRPERVAVVSTAAPNIPQGTGARNRERAYPYYGNTPEELIPFRGVEPHFRYWTERLPFRGPGHEVADPQGLKSLKIGLLSPNQQGPEAARGERTRRGVELAFEEAEAARRPDQLPFEIVYKEDSPQWGSAGNVAVEFSDHDVLGFLGTIDGDATHVALRVALKIETYMINTSDPDPTLTETQIPWLTRIFPDDRQQCFRLALLAVKEQGCRRIAILRENSRPGRVGVMHFANSIRRLGFPPVQHFNYPPGAADVASQIEGIQAANVDAVLFYGQPEDVGRLAAKLRAAGVTAKFFGFDRLREQGFLHEAGASAEGMTITYFFNPDRRDVPWVEFVERFQKRYGERPDVYAAYGYDGARMMMEAIRKVGPNRYRVRNYLASMESWDGVTGHMILDGRWDNIVPVSLAEYRNGQWRFRPAPELRNPGD
jgi:ABC-type branched-subunit amino acid transport system substrate-binding protein